MFESARIKFVEIGENVKERSLGFLEAHPKATALVVGGASTCTALMTTGISASAEGASEDSDLVDTVVTSMQSQMNGALGKVLPAAIGIGISVFVVSFGYKLFKKFTH